MIATDRPLAASTRKPLLTEVEQVAKHPEDRAVGHLRQRVASARLAGESLALEEREPSRVEEVALPRGDLDELAIGAVVTGPAVDQPEQADQVSPGPVALIHRVGVAPFVLDEPGEQAGDRVVADEEIVAGEGLALLGVKQEDQPHQNGEQPFIDLRGAVGPVANSGQKPTARILVGGLEPLDQLEKRGEHLLGKLGGDLVLELAALRQDLGKPLPAGQDMDSLVIQQSPQRRAGQAPRRLEKGFEREGDISRLLSLGPINQPDARILEDQADGNPGFVKQPLELLLRRLDPGAVLGVGRLAVEADAARHGQAEQSVPRTVLERPGPAIGEAGLESVVILGERVADRLGGFGEVVGPSGVLLAGEHPRGRTGAIELQELRLPAEEVGEERAEVGKDAGRDRGVRLFVVEGGLRDGQVEKGVLSFGRLER